MEEPGERAVMKSKSPEFIARAIESKKRDTGWGSPLTATQVCPARPGRVCAVYSTVVTSAIRASGEKKIRDAGVGLFQFCVCVHVAQPAWCQRDYPLTRKWVISICEFILRSPGRFGLSPKIPCR